MTRADTIRLQHDYPKGTILEFREDGKQRLGQVLSHADGKMLVVSPPDASVPGRRLGLTAAAYEQVQKEYRVRGDEILGVRTRQGAVPGTCQGCGHDVRDRAEEQRKAGKGTVVCPKCGRAQRLANLVSSAGVEVL